MANIMTKRGNQDNVITYEHICDTTADMANIEARYKTLGSVCIVLQGESGGLEVYMMGSNKEWVSITEIAASGGSGSGSNTEIDLSDYYQKPSGGIPTSDLADFSREVTSTTIFTQLYANFINDDNGYEVKWGVDDFQTGPAVLQIGDDTYNLNLVRTEYSSGVSIESQELTANEDSLLYIWHENSTGNDTFYIYTDKEYDEAQEVTISAINNKINVNANSLYVNEDKLINKNYVDSKLNNALTKTDAPLIDAYGELYDWSIDSSCSLQFTNSSGNPIPYSYWTDMRNKYVNLSLFDGENSVRGLYAVEMNYYVITFRQIDGNNVFQTLNLYQNSINTNNQTVIYYKGKDPKKIPDPPLENGTYTLQCTVSNAGTTYSWV